MSVSEDNIFLRNFALVLAGLVAVTVLLVVFANVFFGMDDPERQVLAEERALQNFEPSYAVRLTGEPAPGAAAADEEADEVVEVRSGEQVTQAVCIACHQGDFLNAPGVGDVAAWDERIGKGWQTLVDHTVNGFGSMPAQGGAATEEEIRAAIEWMVEDQTGLEIPES